MIYCLPIYFATYCIFFNRAIRNRYTIDFLIKTADLEPKESKDKESVEEEQERMDFATDDDTTSDAD